MQRNENTKCSSLAEAHLPFVVSSNIRAVRNIKDYPFVNKMSDSQKRELESSVIDYVTKKFQGAKVYSLSEIKEEEKDYFYNSGYINKNFLNSDKGTFIVIKDKDISIVLNAEEHLLIRIIKQGMLNQEDYKRFEEFEKILSDKFIFSASSRYGYLTANVKNSGLGLKLTVLVHLKGIAQSNKIDETVKLFSERGYGIIPLSFDKEHKETEYFKVITRLTFGVSELELLDRFIMGIDKLIDMNKSELVSSYDDNKLEELSDSIYRSFGIIQYARQIEYNEALHHLTNLRLGLELGLRLNVTVEVLNKLFFDIQEGNVKKVAFEKNISENRARAEIIKRELSLSNGSEFDV